MENRQFDVRVTDYEPLSLGGTKRQRYERKRKLLEKVEGEFEPNDLQRFRNQYQGKLVKVSAVFFLWKGPPHVTETVFRKDLDNLVKPVLDILQNYVDEKKTARGWV
jgi:Holliday junction resolvase RusA-like endonuclease